MSVFFCWLILILIKSLNILVRYFSMVSMKYEVRDLSLCNMNVLMCYLNDRENLLNYWRHKNDGSKIQEYCVLGFPIGTMKIEPIFENGKTKYNLEFDLPKIVLDVIEKYCEKFF